MQLDRGPQGALTSDSTGNEMSSTDSELPSSRRSASRAQTNQEASGELPEYQAVSGLAVGSLVLGIVSVAALAGQVLWGLPLVGAITAVVALARIDRSAGTLVGRRLALWGLGLSIFFGAIAPAHFLTNERLLADRAAEVGQKWFTALAHGEPQVARQLNVPFKSRARTSDPAELWVHYREAAGDRKDLEQFVADPLIRALLELNGRAVVRQYGTPTVGTTDEQAIVVQTYAVTYGEGAQRRTFFVNLQLERNLQRGPGYVDWRVAKSIGGIEPQ